MATTKLPLRPQQRALLQQGRCFKCHKKGHRAAECLQNRGTSTHNSRSAAKDDAKSGAKLADLPVELIEIICDELVFPRDNRYVPFHSELLPLRLTSRGLRAKTEDFFVKHAFRRCAVRNTYRGFQRLLELSKVPHIAAGVQTLALWRFDGMGVQDYEELQGDLTSTEISAQNQRSKTARIRQAEQQQDSLTFFETSAMDGMLLANALANLKNLRAITAYPSTLDDDRMPLRKQHDRGLASTTHMFSMLMAAMTYSGIRLQKLDFSTLFTISAEGIDIQALCMPHQVLLCLVNLEHLKLGLQTKSGAYRSTIPRSRIW